jgi:hypothetical protein
LRANPLLAALVFAAVVGFPLLALAAGREATPLFDAAASDPALARAFALAGVLAATTIGFAIGALLPTRALLGPQLAPAPVARGTLFAGLTLLPALFAVTPVAAVLAAFAAAAAGAWGGTAVVAGAGAAAALGAAASEAFACALRRSRVGAAVMLALGATWAVAGALGGSMALGPAAVVAGALAEPRPSSVAVLACVATTAVGLWAIASAARPPDRPVRGVVRLPVHIPRRASAAVAVAAVARLARNSQMRRHVATGLLLAVVGSLVLRVLVAGASPFFGASVALVTAAAVPLVASGLRRDAAWLLRVTPVTPSRIAAADAAAAVAASYGVLAVVLAAASPFGVLGLGTLLMLEATAALVLGSAAASGAMLPWRGDRVLDQLASYALLGAIVAMLTFALGRAVEAAPPALGATQLAALLAHLVLLAGIVFAAVIEE